MILNTNIYPDLKHYRFTEPQACHYHSLFLAQIHAAAGLSSALVKQVSLHDHVGKKLYLNLHNYSSWFRGAGESLLWHGTVLYRSPKIWNLLVFFGFFFIFFTEGFPLLQMHFQCLFCSFYLFVSFLCIYLKFSRSATWIIRGVFLFHIFLNQANLGLWWNSPFFKICITDLSIKL